MRCRSCLTNLRMYQPQSSRPQLICDSVVKERTELAALERENRELAEEAAREAAEGEQPDPAAERIAKCVARLPWAH